MTFHISSMTSIHKNVYKQSAVYLQISIYSPSSNITVFFLSFLSAFYLHSNEVLGTVSYNHSYNSSMLLLSITHVIYGLCIEEFLYNFNLYMIRMQY